MKTKLLYIVNLLFILFASCSVDENSNQISTDEKELAVKNLFENFSESIVHSASYSKFILAVQTKSSSGVITEEEMTELEQEFLSQQSKEFIELYYFVVGLDLTENELRDIVLIYFSSVNKNFINDLKGSDDCTTAENSAQTSLLSILGKILCEISRSSRDQGKHI